VKIDTNTMARLMFVTVLLLSTVVGAIWYWHSVSGYATYQINMMLVHAQVDAVTHS
jgi:phospholipid/cholesterol/gamma-HCH transport system substrate-binding protein